MSTKNKFGVALCFFIIASSIGAVLVPSEAMTAETEQALAMAVGGFAPMAVGGLLLFAVFRYKAWSPEDEE